MEHESNDDEKVTHASTIHDCSMDQLKSETMASLQQIRKFRLQRSSHMHKNTHSMDDLRLRFKDIETKAHDDERIALYQNTLVDVKADRDSSNNDARESGKLRKLFSRMKSQNSQKLQEERTEFVYSSDDGESENASEHRIEYYPADTAQKSRELYARYNTYMVKMCIILTN